MARIKIELPTKFTFSTEIKVRITDLNYGAHLGNDRLLGLIHEARVQFLENYGFTEQDMLGVSLIMSDCAIQYKNEAFYNDILVFSIAATEFSNKGFEMYYLVVNKVNNLEVARAKTGMVAFNYLEHKVVALPPILKDVFYCQSLQNI